MTLKNSNYLISIIIPIYNRAHLIGETLNSILNQTYKNWECIIVDDGSQDDSVQVIKEYVFKDKRFKLYERPTSKTKGACSCRNIGFEKSFGEYVVWFDSDDLMCTNYLELKLEVLLRNKNLDFVVSKCVNFFEDGSEALLEIKDNKTEILDCNNFILYKVFWITGNFMICKNAVNTIRFDELLPSNQEFNFFVKLLAVNNLEGEFVDEVLFRRRMHSQSIQGSLFGEKKIRNKHLAYKRTFLEVKEYLNKEARQSLFNSISTTAFKLSEMGTFVDKRKELFSVFYNEKGFLKTVFLFFTLLFARIFKKGFILLQFSRK